MSVDPVPKVFIQNKLRKCREKLQELQPIISSQSESLLYTLFSMYSPSNTLQISEGDAAQTARSIENYRPDHSVSAIDELTDVGSALLGHRLRLLTSSGYS